MSGAFAWTQRNLAVTNEEKAIEERDRALVTQSRFLADASRKKINDNDPGTAILLALEALPQPPSNQNRPYVSEAEDALYAAMLFNREASVFSHQIPVGGISFTGGVGSFQNMQSTDSVIGQMAEEFLLAPHIVAAMGGLRASFSADGHLVLTSGTDGCKLWNAISGRLLWSPTGECGNQAAALSRDGRRVAVNAAGNTAQVWDVEKRTILADLTGHKQLLTSIDFSSDGRRVVTASWDGTALLFDVGSGELLRTFTLNDGITQAIFDTDGACIVTMSSRGATLWDAVTGTQLSTFGVGGRYVLLSASGRLAVTYAFDSPTKLWEARSARLIAEVPGERGLSVAFSGDEHTLFVGDTTGRVRAFSSADGKELGSFQAHLRGITSLGFGRDNLQLLTSSFDGTARIYDVHSGVLSTILAGHTKGLTSAVWSPDGSMAFTTSLDGTARAWKLGPLIQTDDLPVTHAAKRHISSDGKFEASISEFSVHIKEIATGTERVILIGHKGTVFDLSFNPHGDTIATASLDGTVRIWNSTTGAEISRLEGHNGPILSIAFSPDGRRLATGSSDKSVIIWDVATRQPVARIGQLGFDVRQISFSSDASRLLLWRESGPPIAWPFFHSTEALVALAKSVVPRCLTKEQRATFYLPAEPPRWCITGPGHEAERDPTKWEARWPFNGPSWRDWLTTLNRGEMLEMPKN